MFSIVLRQLGANTKSRKIVDRLSVILGNVNGFISYSFTVENDTRVSYSGREN